MTRTHAEKNAIIEIAEKAKEGLNKAFRALRKQGFIARQNYSCCRGCAGNEIANQVTAKIDAGKLKDTFKGAVFTTRQDQMFEESRYGSLTIHKVYLAYGPVDTAKHGEQGVSTKEAGDLVVAALKEAGVSFEWDGDGDSCILVNPCPGEWPEPGAHTLRV